MNKSINRIITLTSRNIKELIREPLSLIFTFALPLVMEVLFYYIFHSLTPQFEMKYLAPGIVIFSQAFLTLFVGLVISLDRSSAFLTRLFVTKTKPIEFIVSYALSVVPFAVIQSILFFFVGVIIEPSIFSVNIILCILLSLVTSIFFIGTGILFGCICNEKSIGGISSIVITGQSVLSGMWFPLDGLDGGIITFMNCLPFKNAVDLLQNTLNGIVDPFKDFVLPLLIVLAYSLVVIIIAVVVFKHKMKEK